MSYREIPKDKILKFPATPGFKGWKDHFTEDSITHPAKMNLNLLRWILKTYTKPGEIVLDPMAGTGSTIVLSSLLGRHGVAVEYEPRFCEMIRENIKRTSRQSTLTPKGRMTCIQGDARELSKLLGETDAIITSPPYSESIKDGNVGLVGAIERASGISRKVFLNDRKKLKEAINIAQEKRPFRYSNDLQNIGNLPHGDIETIITSPPFGPSTTGGGIFREGYKAPGEEEVSDPRLPERHSRPLSDDPRNIDNLEYGKVDAVVTSPPYSLTREGSDRIATGIDVKTGKSLWNKTGSEFSEGNIQKLPHGDVDAVITSPPYEGSVPAYDEKWLEEHWDDESDSPKHKTMRFGRSMRRYPKKVDAVVTSPPYEGSYLGGGDQEARKKRLIESGHDVKDFFGGKARGATLKHYDEVDAVVTSPPYGNRLADEAIQDGDEARISYRQAIDSIVTSPPYEEALTGGGQVDKEGFVQGHTQGKHCFKEGYSTDEDNIGNLKSESYLEAMLQVYRECHKVLKPEGAMILVTKNFIRDKKVVRLDLDTIKLCEAAGFRLSDRWYFKLPTRSFWRILYRRKYPDVPEVEYEDILVFTKEAEGNG